MRYVKGNTSFLEPEYLIELLNFLGVMTIRRGMGIQVYKEFGQKRRLALVKGDKDGYE